MKDILIELSFFFLGMLVYEQASAYQMRWTRTNRNEQSYEKFGNWLWWWWSHLYWLIYKICIYIYLDVVSNLVFGLKMEFIPVVVETVVVIVARNVFWLRLYMYTPYNHNYSLQYPIWQSELRLSVIRIKRTNRFWHFIRSLTVVVSSCDVCTVWTRWWNFWRT